MAVGLSFAAPPAVAQFGSIFRDEPPRPPANIPDGRSGTRSSPPPLPRQDVPSTVRPPLQTLPVPTNLPPAGRPGGNPIQSQPLPPPGGRTAPSQAARPQQTPANEPSQQNAAPAPIQPAPPSAEVSEPPPQRIANPTAVFAGLDKITGRITSFDVAINETVQFGALRVAPRVCYSRPPTETPRTDAFLDVDEVTLQGEVRRIFTGWMFASSPGLHAVEHPIYDIWLTDCKGGSPAVAESSADSPSPQAPQKPPAPAQRAQRPR